MCKPTINKCAQVLLEAVMVFICLALIAVIATKLFANLNLNMLDRLDIYRNCRLDAVNNPARLAGKLLNTPSGPRPLSDPATFLDYSARTGLLNTSPHSGIDLIPEIPEGLFNESFLEEPRMVQAALLLEEMDNILNIILPYKVNQANSLVQQLHLVPTASPPDENWVWEPEENIDAIETLVGRSIQLTERAYNSFCQAIELYRDVLANPTIPGHFDPHPENHPDLYGLNPEDPNYNHAIENLRNQNNTNRQNLQDTINNLESAKPSLENWKNIIIEGLGEYAYLGLRYVIEGGHLGSLSCHTEIIGPPTDPTEITICEPATEHLNAVETLKQAVDFTGDISSPSLNSGLAGNINQLYSLFQAGVESYEQALSARDLAQSILNDTQVQNDPNLKNIAESLNENLNSAIEHWDDAAIRNDYLDLSFTESWGLYEVANLSTS